MFLAIGTSNIRGTHGLQQLRAISGSPVLLNQMQASQTVPFHVSNVPVSRFINTSGEFEFFWVFLHFFLATGIPFVQGTHGLQTFQTNFGTHRVMTPRIISQVQSSVNHGVRSNFVHDNSNVRKILVIFF